MKFQRQAYGTDQYKEFTCQNLHISLTSCKFDESLFRMSKYQLFIAVQHAYYHCLVGSTCLQIETRRATGYKDCTLGFCIRKPTSSNMRLKIKIKICQWVWDMIIVFRHTVTGGIYTNNLNCVCVRYKSNTIMHSTRSWCKMMINQGNCMP